MLSPQTLRTASHTCKTIRAIALPLFDRYFTIEINNLSQATKAQEAFLHVQQASFLSTVIIEFDYHEYNDQYRQVGLAVGIWCEILNKLNHIAQLHIYILLEDRSNEGWTHPAAGLHERIQVLAYAVKSLLLLPSMASTSKHFYLDTKPNMPNEDFLYICETFMPPLLDVSTLQIDIHYDFIPEALRSKPLLISPLLVPPPFRMSDSKSGYEIAILKADDWIIISHFLPVTRIYYRTISASLECWKHFAECASSLKAISIDSTVLQAVNCEFSPELWLVNLQELKWTSSNRAGKTLTKLVGSLRTPALKRFSLHIDGLKGLEICEDPALSPFLRNCPQLRGCHIDMSLRVVDWTTTLLDGLQAAHAALTAYDKAMILDLRAPLSNQPIEIQEFPHPMVDKQERVLSNNIENQKTEPWKRRQAFATVERLCIPLEFVEASSSWYQFLKILPRLRFLTLSNVSGLKKLTAYFSTAYLPILSGVVCHGSLQLDQTHLREAENWHDHLSDLVYVSLRGRIRRISDEDIERAKGEWASKGITLNI